MTHENPRQDHTQMWRFPEIDNLEILHAQYVQHEFPRHFHETFVIEAIEQGEDEFFCKNNTYRAGPGCLIVINPNDVHTGRSAGEAPLRYRSMYPDPQLLSRLLPEFTQNTTEPHHFENPVIRDASLTKLFLETHRRLSEGQDWLHAETQLVLFFFRLVVRHASDKANSSRNGSPSRAVLTAREYLCDCYNENIRLRELAEVCRLSPYHLLRAFRKEVGLPPHEFLVNVRIARAKALLAKGASISQVAYETGFSDQSHLTRHFKRSLGVTPGQYIA